MLGEEGTDHVGTSGVRWVVDPLDGTTNYLLGLPGFNVSIAAREIGDTIVAATVFDVVPRRAVLSHPPWRGHPGTARQSRH